MDPAQTGNGISHCLLETMNQKMLDTCFQCLIELEMKCSHSQRFPDVEWFRCFNHWIKIEGLQRDGSAERCYCCQSWRLDWSPHSGRRRQATQELSSASHMLCDGLRLSPTPQSLTHINKWTLFLKDNGLEHGLALCFPCLNIIKPHLCWHFVRNGI